MSSAKPRTDDRPPFVAAGAQTSSAYWRNSYVIRNLLFPWLLAYSPSALAAEQCTKDFPYRFVQNDGTLGLYFGCGGQWWYPCSVSATRNGVTAESCKAALATYLTAKAQAEPITVRYPGKCEALDSCESSVYDGFEWFGVYWGAN